MTKIVFIGEAWGESEARFQSPFLGAAGQELSRMLHQAGYPCEFLPYNFSSATRMLRYWDRFPFTFLNVFNARPPENDVEFFYTREASPTFPPRRFDNKIYYVKPEYESHIRLLHETLKELKPNVIVALGNTALWALGLPASISKLRGNVIDSPFGKVLPTYHPASVLRKWNQRVISILDLHKALRESNSPTITTLAREIWTEPSISDLYLWWELYGSKAELLAFDIETVHNKQISEISFASDSTHALHVPFFYKENRRYVNWWPDTTAEFAAWEFVKMVCESDIPKIGQNCIQYDSYWLAKEMKIGVKNITHDTMQLSHAWALELEKSLGFLGSIFLDETAWKHIRVETGKQND
jgi:uracil-DNA glycosylase